MASQAGVSPTEIVASTVPGPARERPLPLTVTTTLSSTAPVLGSETNTARVPTWFSPAKNSDGLKCTSTVQLTPGARVPRALGKIVGETLVAIMLDWMLSRQPAPPRDGHPRIFNALQRRAAASEPQP